MRGKAKDCRPPAEIIRITPAYAGKSQSKGNAACVRKDHPRLCGEKGYGFFVNASNVGSPPPMRGKAYVLREDLPDVGITPAYAGKRISALSSIGVPKDHPRLCGEKREKQKFCLFFRGSPPPMRGKGSKQIQALEKQRITPAYAGKSEKARNCVIFTGDHPRLCGEKAFGNSLSHRCIGSPPPMRGKD